MESSLAFKEERIFALDKFQFPLEGYESFLVNVIRGLSHFSKGYVSSAEPPHGATNSFADLPSSFRLVGELRFDMSDSLKTRRVGQREQVEILCDSECDTGRITNENCQKSISRCLDLFAGELDNRFPGRVGAIPINCGAASIDLGRGNHGLSSPYCNISGFELGIYFEIPKGFYSGQVSLVNKGLMIGHPGGMILLTLHSQALGSNWESLILSVQQVS